MNDDFLKNYKKQPRPEFARSLQIKLKQGETMKSFKPLLRYAMLMLLLAFVLIAAVPTARAQAAQVFAAVFMSSEPLPQNSEQPVLEGSELVPVEMVSLAEAHEQLNYPLLLPIWAPEGYVLAEDEVTLVSLRDEVMGVYVRWFSEEGVITLMINPVDQNGLVRPQGGEVTELEVNGNPAFLMRSEFSVSAVPMTDGTPGPDIVINPTSPIISLSWIQDGVQYDLSGSLSEEDILRMAESLQ